MQFFSVLKYDLEVLLRHITLHPRRDFAIEKQQTITEGPLGDKAGLEIGVFG